MSTETTNSDLDPKTAFEQGVAHAADMFELVRHIVACRNGPGLSTYASARILNFRLSYPDGQINVGEAFIQAVIENPSLTKGFGAVITGVLGLIEQGRTIHNLAEEAKVTYEEWLPKGPFDDESGAAQPAPLPVGPTTAASEVA